VTIEPLRDLKGWFKVTFKSWRNSIDETTIELLVTDETLKSFRQQIDKAIGEKSNDYPENIKRFMEDE